MQQGICAMFRNQYATVVGLVLILGITFSPVNAQESSTTAESFEAQLAERDAIIIALQHSVEELNRRLAALEKQLQAESPQALPDSQPDRSESRNTDTGPATTSRQSDPARLPVDLLAAERALERTLVEAGALLLPKGAIELTPSAAYSVTEFDFPTILDTGEGDELAVVSVNRAATSLGLTARIGLPFDSQLELGMPYQSVTEESTLAILSSPVSRIKETGRGSGDLLVGLSKTFLRESGYAPDIVGRVTWNTGQGTESDNDVFLGGGFSSLSGSLSFVKRLDPLALFLALDYQDTHSQGGIAPGDAFGVSIGTGLAVSPASSLFGSVTHRSISETKIDGETVAGSDLDVTSLTIGFSTILSRGTLLNLYSEVGMSDDAPDYTIGFSIPIRVR
jgi:hypothetical protein